MTLHASHRQRFGRSHQLMSIVLAFVALFIPGCEMLEPFLRARTLHAIEADAVRCEMPAPPSSRVRSVADSR